MTDIRDLLEATGEVTEINIEDNNGEESSSIDNSDTLYRIERSRDRGFDDEVLFVRLLSGSDHNWDELLEKDTRQLELEFYNDNTPNQWNIQLFWAYDSNGRPSDEIRRELESRTKFAIRRCVPQDSLKEFLRPLEYSLESLSEVNSEFGRDALIHRVTGNGLGFLFDQSSNRDQKFEQLLKLDLNDTGGSRTSAPIPTTEERPPAVDSVRLGNFRKEASKRDLNLAQFTLLYGRNGTGKTSLLDGITMGMVGQTRRDDDRVDSYNGLSVTLEGDDEPLPTDSKPVNDRIADWFGFRPQGPARRCVEFYRVNYHEAGETTRLLEPSKDLEIERVFRNFLYGEDLAYATKEKDGLLDLFDRKIWDREEEIEKLRVEREKLQDRRDDVKKTISTLGSAQRDLSPASSSLVVKNDSAIRAEQAEKIKAEDEEPPSEQIKRWRDWLRRFERIEMALEATMSELKWQTVDELRSGLNEEARLLRARREDIETIRGLKDKRNQVLEVAKHIESESLTNIPFPTFFTGLLFVANGITGQDASQIVRGIEETDIKLDEIKSIQSTESWFATIEEALREQRQDLNQTRNRLEELGDLENRRQELREQIRSDTEEYLKITDDEDVQYCPACYIEQSAESIRSREEPEHTHDAGGVPKKITESLGNVEQALKVIEDSDPVAIDEDIRRYGDNLCGFPEVPRLLNFIPDGSEKVLFTEVTPKTVEALAWPGEYGVDDNSSTERAISKIKNEVHDEILEESSDIRDFNPNTNLNKEINECEDRLSTVRKGLDVIDNHWPEELLEADPDIKSDRRTLEFAVKEAADGAVSKPVKELSEEIDKKTDNIEYKQDRIKKLKQTRNHLNQTFAGVEESLDEVLNEYTDIVTTLFKVFQRPYEFKRVELTDNNDELQVVRRENGEVVGIDEMSSGQRTALVLAIFVTNNIAHDSSPPLMLLDEPFAHLDELNTLSFFNLVIELAVRGDRQIVFATANDNLASLLKRKVGETEEFERIDLENRST